MSFLLGVKSMTEMTIKWQVKKTKTQANFDHNSAENDDFDVGRI